MLHEVFLRVAFEKPSVISWLTSWVNVAVATSTAVTPWEARFAAVCAGISAIAATIYTVVRICKELHKK
jgi:hypothetical protein